MMQKNDIFEDEMLPENSESQIFHLTVPIDLAGMRLDAAIAKMLPDYSRNRISQWIKDGFVLL